jgi:hypothetical protein
MRDLLEPGLAAPRRVSRLAMGRISATDMAARLKRIEECDRRFKEIYEGGKYAGARFNAGPPASEEELSALSAAVPFSLPPSYLDLLRINNGVTNFKWIRDHLISSHERIQSPDLDDWPDRPEMWFIIAGDDNSDGVAFDRNTSDLDGEMEVVEFANYREDSRWPSLSDFLAGYLARLEDWILREQA